MSRRLFALCCLFVTFALGIVGAQPAAKKPPMPQPVYLRILLPDEKATLLIDEKATKQSGTKRIFVTPPLEPGKTFNYTITVKWEENNVETIRTRVIQVEAGKTFEIDLRTADAKDREDTRSLADPPPEEVVEEMCKLAKVGKDDVVFDIGCGDGRIVLTAVADYEAKRGVGIDSDAKLLKEAEDDAKDLEVADRVSFRKQDLKAYKDLNDATVVMLSKGKDANLKLMPFLKKVLKPGSRIVSHNAGMGDWKADKTVTVEDEKKVKHFLHLWVIKK